MQLVEQNQPTAAVQASLRQPIQADATSAGKGRRKRKVTQCHHCHCQGRQTPADFVHLDFYPATDLGPIGFCWSCYEKAAKDLLAMYASIVKAAAKVEALYNALPNEERRDVRPSRPPTY